MSPHEMLGLVPLYALDALEGEEEHGFEEHLTTCAECRQALDEFRDVAAGLVPDGPPSEAAWNRVSEAVGGGRTAGTTTEVASIDPERTYQLWVINDNEDVISAGVLGNDPGPATFTWTGDISGFALTREVAGGVVSSAGDVVSVITEV